TVTSAKPAPAPPAPSAAPAASSASSTPSAASAAPAPGATVLRFDDETEGAMPASVEPVVGDWTIGRAGDAKGLMVDGSKWRNGTPSVNLADQAKRLYGDRYAEFLDGVKTFAFYPLAVARAPAPTGDMRLSVRFYPIAGSVDQAAGIAFGIAPDGSYTGVRANALEDNLLYFTVVKGKRTVHDTVRGVATPSRTWHTLALELRGTNLFVTIDGAKRFEKKLDGVPHGRVGLWSKADSKVLFDDFEIAPL
ncbi:MAG: hypothetical protein JWP87_1223, partial [Labilithrix sp.]|nr:hypothetical protein [Labilithrix sp.]